MLDKINQIKKLKEIQNALKEEKIEAEKNGVKIVLNGSIELEQVALNSSLSEKDQEEALISCFNEAIRKVQMIAAQKMSQMGGF